MRRVPLALVLAIVTSGFPHAQQQSPPVFRAGVRLIVQPVTVTTRDGKPVENLTARDFSLTENGVLQEIAFVEFQRFDTDVRPSTSSGRTATVPPSTSSGSVAPSPVDGRFRGRRLLVLYFDLYGMPEFDQMRAFSSADRYIGSLMTPADVVAVMTFDGRGVRLEQDFTDDRGALREVIQGLVDAAGERDERVNWDPGGAFGEDDDAFNIFATDRQLSALQTAVTDLGPLPELKTLVYFGSGLRLNGADNQAQVRATVNAAVRSNVTLNPIDAAGLVASAPLGDATRPSPGGIGMFSGAMAQAATTRAQQAQDTLYALAKDTGGRAMFDNNDLAVGIAQAARAVTPYYVLGYYTTNAAKDGRFRRVKITVTSARDVQVSYRAGYFGDKEFGKFTRADKERQLADALKLEDPITDIPVAIEVNYFQLNRAEYFVPVSVRLPWSELVQPETRRASRIDIDVIGEIKDEHGVTHRNVRDRLAITPEAAAASRLARRALQYETGFTILPGTYVIKMLVRDATTGRIGTFQRPFTVPNLDRERAGLPISSVVLASQRTAREDALVNVLRKDSDAANPLVHDGRKLIPSVSRTFSAGRPLLVFLHAYEHGATEMRPLVAFVTLYRDGNRVLETEPRALEEQWNPASKAVPVEIMVPLTALAAGPYDCQVTVLDPAGGHAAFWRAPIAVIP